MMHLKLNDEQKSQLKLQNKLQRNIMQALRNMKQQVEASETARSLGPCVTDEVLERTVLMFVSENCITHMKSMHPEDPSSDFELCTGIAQTLGEIYQDVASDMRIDKSEFDS